MAAYAILPGLLGIEAGPLREVMEPARTGGDVADLVAVDALEDSGAVFVAGAAEIGDGGGRHVEAARLQDQRNNGQAGEQVVRRFRRRLPQAVMGRQVAILRAQLDQARLQQREVDGFFLAHLHPVVEESARRLPRAEARDDVPGEVDGVQLDMRQRMEQGDALLLAAAGLALGHVARPQQERALRPRRACRRIARYIERRLLSLPIGGERQGARHLVGGLGRQQDLARAVRQIDHHASASFFTSFSTSSTWPGTFTLRQMPRITPLPSIRNVARSMPMYLRPYMLFSTQTT